MAEQQQSGGPQQPERRDFLGRTITGFSLAVLGFILYPVARFLKQPAAAGGNVKRVVAAKTDELANDSAKIFQFGNGTGILIRKPQGDYCALSAVCTHLSCTVQYVPGENYILCACHNGKYDLNGQVISGPPPRPLDKYNVNEQGDDIVVTRA